MKHLTIIPLIAALLLTVSCTKVLEFDGTETEPMPVLISLPEADSTLSLRLTFSRFFLNRNSYKPIDNATFRTELNGTSVSANLTYDDNGIYRSNLILHENDTLTLHVSIPDQKEITAGCRVPARPNISDLSSTINIHYDTSYYDWIDSTFSVYTYGDIDISFRLHDPAGQSNYYMLQAYTIDSTTGDRIYLDNIIDDNILFDTVANEYSLDLGGSTDLSEGYQTFFTDERINGKDHTIKVHIDTYGNFNGDIYLDICALSRDAYLYHVTLINQENSDDIMGFLSEPVQIHTNIQNGIGILGASTPLRIKLTNQ